MAGRVYKAMSLETLRGVYVLTHHLCQDKVEVQIPFRLSEPLYKGGHFYKLDQPSTLQIGETMKGLLEIISQLEREKACLLDDIRGWR